MEEFIKKNTDIDTEYDQISANELWKRLNRQPSPNEIINSDKDSDLVTETLWQIVKKLEKRVTDLENGTALKK